MKHSRWIYLTAFTFSFLLFSSIINADEVRSTERSSEGKKLQQQVFLSPAPLVLPQVPSPPSQAPVPMGEKIDTGSSTLGTTPPQISIPEQTQFRVTAPQEKLEAVIQQKMEKPIQPLPLPEKSVSVTPPAQPLTVPLPGRVPEVPIVVTSPKPIPVEVEPIKVLEPVVVTATKTPVPASQLASSVSVITGGYLQDNRIGFVGDALRSVPGVALRQLGGLGRQTNLFIRGGNDGQAVVMIDGVKVNSPTSGDYNFANLSTNLIDRIEILKGPQSTLYGSQAMSGVVNIITKQATQQPRFSTRVEYGSFSTLSEDLTLSNRFKKGDYAFSASRIQSDGISQDDGFENMTLASRFGINFSEESRLNTTYRLNTGLVNIDDGAYRPDHNRYSKVRQHIAQTNLRSQFSERWEQKLSGSVFHDRLFSLDISDPGTKQKDSRFKLDADIYTLEWQNNYRINDSNLVTAGYEWRQTTANNKSFDQTVQNHGFYFQDQVSLAERLFLTAGIRLDNNEDYGKTANPRFSMAHLWPKTATKMKGSLGTAFKAPTLNQLYFPGFGNPNLSPEKSFGYDMGLEQKFLQDKMTLGATYFHNRYRELLENRTKADGSSEPVNIGVAKTEGIEWELGYQLKENLTLSSHYNFLIAKDLTTGAPLRRRPKHSGGISLGYTGWEHWGLHLNTTLAGKRQDDVSAPGRPTRMTNPGYVKVDLVTSYEYKPGKKFYSKIENLTNSHYDEVLGFGSAGTTLSVGSDMEF